MQPYQFSIGNFKATIISDNERMMPIDETFPGVRPEALREGLRALGLEVGPVGVGYNVLLIDTGREKVLIDAGGEEGRLVDSLASAGITPQMIDVVLITHGDGDHTGGLDRFPAARIVLPALSWELWTTPHGQERMVEEFIQLFRGRVPDERLKQMAARRAAYGRETLPRLRPRLDLVEPDVEFLPGFTFVAAPGHRRDHFAVKILSNNQTLLHIVDGLRHPVQAAHPEWTAYIDSDPVQTAATNRRLLERAAREKALLFATHLPFPGLGRVWPEGDAWRWEPA